MSGSTAAPDDRSRTSRVVAGVVLGALSAVVAGVFGADVGLDGAVWIAVVGLVGFVVGYALGPWTVEVLLDLVS